MPLFCSIIKVNVDWAGQTFKKYAKSPLKDHLQYSWWYPIFQGYLIRQKFKLLITDDLPLQ